jgi:hypothetical protein
MSDEPNSTSTGAKADKKAQDEATVPAAHKVIEAFGGIRPMAQKLGVAASTVQGWKERGVIPPARHERILELAKADKLNLDAGTVASSAQMPDDPTEDSAGSKASDAKAGDPKDKEAAAPQAKASSAIPKSSSQATAPQASAPARQGSDSWGVPMALGALVLLVGIGIAVVAREIWLPLVDEDDAVASAEVEALQRRVASLESRPNASEQIGALSQRITAIGEKADQALSLGSGAVSESAIAALQAEIDRQLAERGESLDQIIARLDRVESHQVVRPVSTSDLALTLSLGSLREQIFTGQPFAETLEAALLAARPRPDVEAALQPLGESADTGVLRLVRLQESFRAASRDIVAAAAGEGEENALLAGIKRRLSQVVTVRPSTENAAEGSPELAVGLAEDALAAGNLGDALDALSGLPESAAAAAEPWLTEARRRYEAEQAVEEATRAFLSALQAAN